MKNNSSKSSNSDRVQSVREQNKADIKVSQTEQIGKEQKLLSSDREDLIGSLLETIETMKKDLKFLHLRLQGVEDRQTYLEYDLHAEVAYLKDENIGLRQQIDCPYND